jgi:hypothetical protein
VLKLIEPNSLWVKVRLDQGRSRGLAAGQAASIALRSNPGMPLTGKVVRIEPVSDSVTEERITLVTFDQIPPGLSIGEMAEVTVQTASQSIWPDTAQCRHQTDCRKGPGVWKLRDGKPAFVAIKLGSSSLDGLVQVLEGISAGDEIIVHSERELSEGSRVKVVEQLAGARQVISLAGRDILHSWSKFVLTGIGLGLLIGVTLTMAGVYRGMVDDAKALLNNSGADLWVVQQDTQGPYAESSSIHDDVYRSLLSLPGVARAANVTYLTMQVRLDNTDVRAMVVGFEPGSRESPVTWLPAATLPVTITRPSPTSKPGSSWAIPFGFVGTTTGSSA